MTKREYKYHKYKRLITFNCYNDNGDVIIDTYFFDLSLYKKILLNS